MQPAGTAPKPTLEQAYGSWKARQSSAPETRLCLFPGCMVFIEDNRARFYCYGHGGLPDDEYRLVPE